MNTPRIQNDDRGITLNKSLAWTVFTCLAAAAFWFGTELAQIKTEAKNVNQNLLEEKTRRVDLENRVRELESLNSGFKAELRGLSEKIEDVKSMQREINNMLKGLVEK